MKPILCLLILSALGICYSGCKKDNTDDPQTKTYEYEAIRSHCDPLIISVGANQTLTITAKDSVHTNVNGVVQDCDFWTDADGIPDCHYVDDIPELHGLPFMALIGKFGDDYFLVGKNYKHTFSSTGTLELSVNDWGGCGEDSDNAGKFVITVVIEM